MLDPFDIHKAQGKGKDEDKFQKIVTMRIQKGRRHGGVSAHGHMGDNGEWQIKKQPISQGNFYPELLKKPREQWSQQSHPRKGGREIENSIAAKSKLTEKNECVHKCWFKKIGIFTHCTNDFGAVLEK